MSGKLKDECVQQDCRNSLISTQYFDSFWSHIDTGKSLSEALILASTNPQYDDRLFIDLQVYMKMASSDHVVYTICFLFWHSEQFIYTTCSELAIFMYWTCNSMNNFLSYCRLVDARISASEKYLPVRCFFYIFSTQIALK